MWSRPMTPSRIIGFLKNGTQVFAPVNQDDPTYIINDVETGAEIRRLKFEYLPDWRLNVVEIIPGSDQLYVGWVYIKPGTPTVDLYDLSIQRPMVYQIIDSNSGKCISGSFKSHYRSPVTFSPDGKYFWSYNASTTNGLDLVETQTGKVLFEARNDVTRRPHHSIAFAPNSQAVATLWFSDKTKQFSIEILELPSCQVRFIQTMATPPLLHSWGWLQAWTDRLYVAGIVRLDQASSLNPSFSFQVEADKLTDMRIEPLREEYTRHHHDLHVAVKDAGNQLVEITYGQKHTATSVFQWLEQLAQKFGRSMHTSGHQPVSVKTIDKATGKTIAHLSAPDLVSFYSVLSPDGTRLASWHPLKGLLMWDTQPAVRWPWAWGSAFLVCLLLQCLRHRFTRKASSAGTPCSPAS